MHTGPGLRHSAAALERFLELIARLDAGEPVDFEVELGQPAALERELRDLHRGWLRLRGLLDEVRCDARDLRSAVASAGASPLGLDARSRRLIELLARFRGSEWRYEELGEIARGGMGVVLRVRERGLERELALKRMASEDELAPELRRLRLQMLRRLIDEAWVLSRLDHPGIVQLHELGVDAEGRVYFTMPLVRGRTLTEIFRLAREKREEWSLVRALELLQRVCEALSFAHANGIVHRDLKPANVMVGRFGEVQVMDWGLARVFRREPGEAGAEAHEPDGEPPTEPGGFDALDGAPSLTLAGDVIGTPAYMAPEQASGRSREACPRSDVYSMGAMLYELVCGVRPYSEGGTSATTREIVARIKQGPPVPIEQLAPTQPPELFAICRKAMHREREQRYADMNELAADLRAFREGRVVRAFESGAWAELKKWVERNRRVSAALALSTLAILGAALAAAWINARAEERVSFAASLRLPASLRERARALWPAHEHVEELQRWLADARDLVGRRASYQRELDELRSHATRVADDSPEAAAVRRAFHTRKTRWMQERTGLQSEIDQVLMRGRGEALDERYSAELHARNAIGDRQAVDAWQEQLKAVEARLAQLSWPPELPWTGLSPAAQARAAELEQLLAEIDALLDPRPFDGTLAEVEGRLRTAQTLRARSLDAAAELWSEARASIADRRRCPLYDGLDLAPQLGLVPIGRDPSSGLWEFAHLESGAPARRDPYGKLHVEPETGIVFVLVPGGPSTLGAADESRGGNVADKSRVPYDPLAAIQETPIAALRLSSYFLSKYEMTQAQWLRLSGRNPSYHAVGKQFSRITSDLCFPVEHVSWLEMTDVLARSGLILPSEAQWEHAARGGVLERFWWGADLAGACGRVNCMAEPGTPCAEDPWERTARVDSLDPNPWGFYCILGNVAEPCSDNFWSRYMPCTMDGRARQVSPDGGLRAVRGGHFGSRVQDLRVTFRTDVNADQPNDCYGIRAARMLDDWQALNAAALAQREGQDPPDRR